MFETFATIAASLYFVFYTLIVISLFYEFSKLSAIAQRKAKINLAPTGIIMYLVSIAWLIAKAIS